MDDEPDIKFGRRTWWNQLLGRGKSSLIPVPPPPLPPAEVSSCNASSKEHTGSTRPSTFSRRDVTNPIPEQPLVRRPASPVPSRAVSSILRFIPRVGLFHEVMKDELLYTTTITFTTFILALCVVLASKLENCLDIGGWLELNASVISVLVIHSFGRVVRRHERDVLLQSSAIYWPENRSPFSRRVGSPQLRFAMPEDRFSDVGAVPVSRDSLASWSSDDFGPKSPIPAISRAHSVSLVPSPKRVYDRIPIRFSNALAPRIHIHQFPLLTRALQVPPSAAASGKRITARIKPVVRRLEVHIPSDTRSEVWNSERGRDLGVARLEDDRERNQETKGKGREMDEPRLSEVRMLSEQVEQPGVYMLGIVRDGQLHLHPISETHQLRPTLTYLDVLSRKNKRSRPGDDSDSDDGPPPDPDEPAPAPALKKERKTVGEAREVHVTARKTDDKSGGAQPLGGLSTARREMLAAIHAEEDEGWHDLQFFDVTTAESEEAFTRLFSQSDEVLQCKEDQTAFLVEGL
ncbi:hypothetical protein HMN09_00616400 [Mycena chlorophos]|uniref:Uncharacterized protein n=1 Tax=Mycena chlorophos TaxID=658473 RepID=A0A8H6WFQ1_MYCCL|nr:hypothetical protein HMN09_00616400 [Mycena chlorophos]